MSTFDAHRGQWRSYTATAWGRIRYAVVRHILLAHLGDVAAGATRRRVLDVGGADGLDSLPLAAAGHEVTVLDPAPELLADAEAMVRRAHPDFHLDGISLDDDATYAMLAQGKTSGVFQLESAGITNVVTGLQPQSIEDITAVVALYRPGPMQSIPRYIECRHHPEKVTYKHPLLEPILKVTYGCMIYQEQVMQVFQSLAGYSLGKADMVRRAMSKKKMKELEPQMEVLDQVLSMLEASKSLVFLSYWSFAKVHGPCIQFVEALMKARNDLDRSAVSEVMDSVKRKVKDEGLTDRKSALLLQRSAYTHICLLSSSTRTYDHEEDCHPRRALALPRAHIKPRRYRIARRYLFHGMDIPFYLPLQFLAF